MSGQRVVDFLSQSLRPTCKYPTYRKTVSSERSKNLIKIIKKIHCEESAGTSRRAETLDSSFALSRGRMIPRVSANIAALSQNSEGFSGEESTSLEAAVERVVCIPLEEQQCESAFILFPEKLMSLLDGAEGQDILWWLPEGDAFCFVPKGFDFTLDKHFHGTKLGSFKRKLNRW